MAATWGVGVTAVRCGAGDVAAGGTSVDSVGALRRVKDTIASGNTPKMRMIAADAHTTVRVQPLAASGRAAAVSLGFMNITITT
jgi:hypothetical protein